MYLLGWTPFENSSNLSDVILESHYTFVPKVANNTIVLQRNQSAGKEIYTDFCIQCHGANGKGDGKNFPPLVSFDWLTKKEHKVSTLLNLGKAEKLL